MRLLRIQDGDGVAVVAASSGSMGRRVEGSASLYDLAQEAIAAGRTLAETVGERLSGGEVDLVEALAQGRILQPIAHPDPAHCTVTGTGLTHLGSAEGRDQMHKAEADPSKLTDSMRMFQMGIEAGKPAPGAVGVQPEWFYKGDGSMLRGPGETLQSPAFALDGGEEPELAGIYLIGPDGTPFRLGFCLANEFSDHVTERGNYLWLAHSKLRQASLGPELLVGELPAHVEGVSRILRGNDTVFEAPFLSGEANMSHSIRNLEHHHFKYDLFRRPGDLHVHFFGTATLSFSGGFRTEPGDRFEIEAAPFTLPLVNTLTVSPARAVDVKAL